MFRAAMTPSRLRAVLIAAIVLVALALVWWARGDHRHGRDHSAATPPPASPPTREPEEPRPVRTPPAIVAVDAATTRVPVPAASDGGATQGRVFARVTWGSGVGQLGHDRPHEGNPEAPMSFAPDPSGGMVVLDQVNHRLVRFGPDGHAAGTIPLTQQAPQDIAVAHDGSIAVLDRLGQPSVSVLGPDGTQRATLPLVGAGVPEGGGVTAMFIDDSSVFVEREHGSLVRVGDLSGSGTDDRSEIPGRPTRDGQSFISAGLIDRDAGRFYVNSIERATGAHRFTRDLSVALVLETILLLDTDRAGTIYAAVQGVPPSQVNAESPTELVTLMCLDPHDGHPLGTALLPANTSADETFRDLIVLDGGGVLYGVRTEAGESFQRYDCR
jgi:hypothetical protein